MKTILNYSKTLFLALSAVAMFTLSSCHKEGTGGHSGVNGNVIRILSPLVIEDSLLNKGLDIIENGLKEILG